MERRDKIAIASKSSFSIEGFHVGFCIQKFCDLIIKPDMFGLEASRLSLDPRSSLLRYGTVHKRRTRKSQTSMFQDHRQLNFWHSGTASLQQCRNRVSILVSTNQRLYLLHPLEYSHRLHFFKRTVFTQDFGTATRQRLCGVALTTMVDRKISMWIWRTDGKMSHLTIQLPSRKF